jgi:hypothetical protein
VRVLNERVVGWRSNAIFYGMPCTMEFVSYVSLRVVHTGCGFSYDGTLIRPYTVCCYGRGSTFCTFPVLPRALFGCVKLPAVAMSSLEIR